MIYGTIPAHTLATIAVRFMPSDLPPLKPRWLPFRVLPDAMNIYEVLHDTGEITQEFFNGRNWPELRGKWSALKWRTKK